MGKPIKAKPKKELGHAARWISNLTLTDEHQGQPFVLRDWQLDDIISPIFDDVDDRGYRKVEKVLLFMPRKCAKSQLAAAIGLYMTMGQREQNGQHKKGHTTILSAANAKYAGELFNKIVSMIKADRHLLNRVYITYGVKRIVEKKTNNQLFVLSGDPHGSHSYNASCVIIDELHCMREEQGRLLIGGLTSGSATRPNPLTILISTAGNQRQGFWYEIYDEFRKIKNGEIINPRYLPVMYEASPEDDPFDENTWRKAMPALGDYVSIDYIRKEFEAARHNPSELAKCQQLYLNLWVNRGETRFLDAEKWLACGNERFNPEDLIGQECWLGGDLSLIQDTSSVVLVFKGEDCTYKVLPFFWLPKKQAEKLAEKGDRRYLDWGKAGHIELTDGETIDYPHIESKIKELAKTYNIRKALVDPNNANNLCQNLIKDGVNVEFIRQGWSLNDPTKALLKLVIDGKINHNNHPVLVHQGLNAKAKSDKNDNLWIEKPKHKDKVDGIVGLVEALCGAIGDQSVDMEGFLAAFKKEEADDK